MDNTQARDEINARFYADWKALTPAVVGGPVPMVRWGFVGSKEKPPSDKHWARVTVIHGDGTETLGERPKRYSRTGAVTVQIFADYSDQGLAIGDKLAKIVRSAFEGKTTPGGVWFRNVRLIEVGREQPWEQINVSADFEYEETVP